MKEIRDAIHGNIGINELEGALLDTPQVQRLRHIKQLGFTYLVYPGANHTRFEHSLGVMHLAGRVAESLKLPNETIQELKVAGLLHDIGHGPFSHSSERTLERFLSFQHETIAERQIKKTKISEILKSNGIDPEAIAQIIQGKKEYGEVIDGDMDVDRMDYLVRDSYYTGVAYGVIDLERLISTLELYKSRVAITGGTHIAESLLQARFLMYPTVYEHHTARIAEAMFAHAIDRALANKVLKPDDLYKLDDIAIISALRHSKGYSRKMMEAIDSRKLFKRAAILNKQKMGEDATKEFLKLRDKANKVQEIETELANAAKMQPGEIILDIPEPLYPGGELSLIVKKDNQYMKATDASVSIRTLEEAQWDYWEVMVFCPKGEGEKTKRAVKKVLNIEVKETG